MSQVKSGDSQEDHQGSLEVEKMPENCYTEVLDSMALTVYGQWIGKGTEKCDLQQSHPKSMSRAGAKMLKSKI